MECPCRIWLGALEGGQPCLLHSLHQPRCPQKQPTFCLGGHPEKKEGHVPVPVEELWGGLSTASGMQRHVHLVHLGRQAEPEQNDGEEDFYYTELDVGMDKLTNRLSSLTPVSPTVSMPPTFPHVEFSELLDPPVLPNLPHPLTLFPSPKLSSSAVPQVCHSDQAYQQGEATDEDWGQVSEHSREKQNRGCDSFQRCLAPNHLEPQPTEAQAYIPALSAKLGVILEALG
ncbi:SLC2A4 regulator isoform X2 [Peromyscus maniculatus bairdii]|uniref:SLC2A4 regulator isoform X2 n=1 Tax=Peromyscus maniculatus bairdii TaxID=230844 RepID=UPI003FD5F6EA